MSCIFETTPVAWEIYFDFESAKNQTDIKKDNVQEALVEASNSFSWHFLPENHVLVVRKHRQHITHGGLTISRGAALICEGQGSQVVL